MTDPVQTDKKLPAYSIAIKVFAIVVNFLVFSSIFFLSFQLNSGPSKCQLN